MSDLSAMIAEIDLRRQRMQRWLAEYEFLPCDVPGCLHPCCRGKTVEQRKSEGRIMNLSESKP